MKHNPVIKVVTLGTGSAIQTAERDNTAILFDLADKCILVDFPGSIIKKITEYGEDSLRIDQIFVTHEHIDHIYGLPSFVHNQLLKLIKRAYLSPAVNRYKLNIFSSIDSIGIMNSILTITGFNNRTDMFAINFHALKNKDGIINLDKNWYVRYISGSHNHTISYGFIFIHKDAGIKLSYSGDTEPTERFLMAAQGSNVLIHECQELENAPKGHSDIVKLVEKLQRFEKPNKLVLVHLSENASNNKTIIQQYVKNKLGVLCNVPSDGETVFKIILDEADHI